MSTDNLRLGADELRALRDLMMGRPTHISSSHRVRRELLGLLKDGPDCPKLTADGKRYASVQQPTSTSPPQPAMPDKRTKRGRRMPFRRALPLY